MIILYVLSLSTNHVISNIQDKELVILWKFIVTVLKKMNIGSHTISWEVLPGTSFVYQHSIIGSSIVDRRYQKWLPFCVMRQTQQLDY
jgi:hypothetical protein